MYTGELNMKKIVLAGVFALGVGLVGSSGASALTANAGVSNAANAASLIERTAMECRRIEVCRMTPAGRVCRIERVCRRVW